MANDKKKHQQGHTHSKRKKDKQKEKDKDKEGKEKEQKEPQPPTPPFKRLFSFATQLDVILIIVGAISSAAAGATMPLLIVVLGDSINTFNSSDLDFLYRRSSHLAFLMVMIGIAAFFAHSTQRICWAYASERQIEAMRIAYLKSIMRQDISYFDKTGTGTLTSQIVSNTQQIQEAIGEKLGLVIQYLSTFVTGIVIGFIFYWKLALVVIATLPLMAGIGAVFGLVFTKSEAKTQAAYAGAGAIANEMISGMRTVQSFNLHEVALEKYTAKITDAKKVAVQKGLYSGASIGAIYFIFFASYSLDFWYGGKLYVNGEVTGGDVLIVILNIIIASFVLGNTASNLDTIAKGLGASASFFAILDRVPTIDSNSEDGIKLDDYDGTLSLNNVHFRYPTRENQKILDGISLDIPAGSKVALVGHSGSGKSSIIQLLQRFYDPEEGEVTLGGHDVKSLNVSWLRYQFGIVGQEPALFSGTIGENIAFGNHETVTQEEIETAARAALAHDFILTFPLGYDTQVGERGAQLSGGQKQRIAIARAILKNPKILLLDEATSALDSRSEKKVQLALDNAAEGRTTIIIAHRLSTVKNADIIAVIDKGTLVELGTHSQLLELNGTYANLVRIQVGGKIDTEDEDPVQEEIEQKQEEDQIEVVVQKTALEKEIKVAKSKMPWKEIIAMSKPDTVPLLIGALGSIVIGVIEPLQAIFFSKIFVSYFLPPDQVMDSLRPWLLVYVGLAVGMLIAYILQGYYFGVAGQNLVYRCRLESFKSILRQEIGWFDKKENSTGALTGKLASEASQVEGALGAPLGSFVICAAALITGITIAYLYSWRFAWVLTLAFPAVLFGGFIEMYSMMPANTSKHEALLSANIVATEAISNVRTVASYVNEARMVDKYSFELLKPKEKSLKQSVTLGLLMGFGQFAVLSVNALGFWYGAKLIRDGDLDFQDFFTGFEAFMFTAQSISVALNMSSSFTKASSGAKQIFALINRSSQIDAQSETGKAPPREEIQGQITFNNVDFSYPTRPDLPVLQGLNLEIRPNEVTALVGASGCGKSSCIGLIERWYDPLEGKVKLDGVDIRKYNIQWLRKTIALVGQEPVLFSGTIADNIAYSVDGATMEEIEEAARSANAHNFITQFPDGYRTQVGEKGLQLSGGQKQRIAIARAIIKKPVVLLLDEATSALDTESEEVVQQALDNVMQGLTTVVIAHRLSTIRRANHIAVIDRGIVIEQGTHDELVSAKGHYYRLVQAQTS